MASIFGSVLADGDGDRPSRPSSFSARSPKTTASISVASALTEAVSALPAADRTVSEFALTAFDLFDECELAELLATIRRYRVRNPQGKALQCQMPRLDRSSAELPVFSEMPPFAGYNFTREDFPGDLISMVWAPQPQVLAHALPAVVHTSTDAAPAIGSTSAWISNRVAAAKRQQAASVLLVSRDGTRAVRRRLDNLTVAWSVLVFDEPLRTWR